MIIDAHVHSSWFNPAERPDAMIQLLTEAAERNQIEKLIVMGSAGFARGPWLEHDVFDCNTSTMLLVDEFPEMCVGCCVLNPANSTSFILDEIRRCIVFGGMRGIKLSGHVNARDKRLRPIMVKAEELDVPVVYHAWYKTTGPVNEESAPADIAYLASRFPKAKIVMAHWTRASARGIFDIKSLRNVFVDTSSGLSETFFPEYAVQQLGADRVIYGSDFVGQDYAVQLARIHGASLADDEKKQILGENAARLFKIS